MNLQEYQPAKFIACVDVVAEQHPIRHAGGLLAWDESDVDALRTILLALTLSDVPEFAAALSVRRLHAAIALLTDDDVAEKAAVVVISRPRASVFKHIWQRVRTEYPDARILVPFRKVAQQCDWRDVRPGFELSDHLSRWLVSNDLALGAANEWSKDFFDPACTISAWLKSLDIAGGTKFHNAVVRAWLVGASKQRLSRIVGASYIALVKKHPEGVRARAMARYLNVLGTRDQWDPEILEQFVTWFGAPQVGRKQNRHWLPVSEMARKQFRSWMLGQQVEEYFKRFYDEKGRGLFWKEFMEEQGVAMELRCRIYGTQRFLAAGLEFDTFGVVEFGQVGNAAYIYPINQYRRIMGTNSDQVEGYKDLRATKSIPGTDGRLLHHDHWQNKWRPRISRMLKRR